MLQNGTPKLHYSETCFLHAPDIKNTSFWDPRTLKFMLLARARCIFTHFHVFHTFLKNVRFLFEKWSRFGTLGQPKTKQTSSRKSSLLLESFWRHFGPHLGPSGLHYRAKMVSKFGSWSQGGARGVQSCHFGTFQTSFWSILGLILDKFRTNLSDVSTIIADISRYSRYQQILAGIADTHILADTSTY